MIFSFKAVYDFIVQYKSLFGGGVGLAVLAYVARMRRELRITNAKLRRNMNDGEIAPIKTRISDIQTQVDISDARAKELEDKLTRSLNGSGDSSGSK